MKDALVIPASLIHLLDQRINLVLSISQITALNKMLELPRPEPTGGIAQLEGPQEVARLLEVRSHRDDLMNQIFHAHDAKLSHVVFDDLVVRQRNALLIDFAVAPLVDELADGFE